MFSELRFDGKIKRVTVSRTAHRWFVSILVDTGTPHVPRDTRGLPVVGIDVGINTLATLNDGTQYENPKPLKRYERKLAREQRKLSRKVFLSENWVKQKRIVERIHYRIACIRRDAHHKATTGIVKRTSKIGIETLQVTNLLKNRKLAKALSDASLGGFLEKLKTKAESLGIPVVQADRFFASSKNCSTCGHKKTDLTLSDREYHCSNCGYREDRDVNAAINLRNLARGIRGELKRLWSLCKSSTRRLRMQKQEAHDFNRGSITTQYGFILALLLMFAVVQNGIADSHGTDASAYEELNGQVVASIDLGLEWLKGQQAEDGLVRQSSGYNGSRPHCFFTAPRK